MTIWTFASALGDPPSNAGYQPGVCNIGPAEIARRRMAGHLGVAATLTVLVLLIAVDAPSYTRLASILPAAVSASGYLQAWTKFCAGYGSLGVFNFGSLGETTAIVDDAARIRDRRRARQISAYSFVIATVVGIVAVLLPI